METHVVTCEGSSLYWGRDENAALLTTCLELCYQFALRVPPEYPISHTNSRLIHKKDNIGSRGSPGFSCWFHSPLTSKIRTSNTPSSYDHKYDGVVLSTCAC